MKINPYSATKAGVEMLVMAYGRSYGLPVITTRGNNVYGPKQFPEKMIPKFMLSGMSGKPLPIHGDGYLTSGITCTAKTLLKPLRMFFTKVRLVTSTIEGEREKEE